jgi:hypothetical protein
VVRFDADIARRQDSTDKSKTEQTKMNQQVDIISDTITNSAKTRFDYAEFKERLD